METLLEIAAKDHALKRFREAVNVDNFNPLKVAADFVDGAKWQSGQHNLKMVHLWQTLGAFRNLVLKTMPTPIDPEILSLVDQCLIENKPENITP